MGKKDRTLRLLLQEQDVAADVINCLVYQNEQGVRKEDLRRIPEGNLVAKESGDLKDLTRDLCVEDVRNGTVYMIYGIENQAEDDYSMPIRVMGYDYASYERQMRDLGHGRREYRKNVLKKRGKKKKTERRKQRKKKGLAVEKGRVSHLSQLQPGEKLSPVITLVLYYGHKPCRMPRDLHGVLQLPEEEVLKRWIPNYPIHVIEVGSMSEEEIARFQSDFRYIAKFLHGKYHKTGSIRTLFCEGETSDHPKELTMALAAISGDARYLKVLQKEKEEKEMRCEMLDRFIEEEQEKGMQKGIEKGMYQLSALIKSLQSNGREDDVSRVLNESAYRNRLMAEYGITAAAEKEKR